jgi:hypothetical protein
MFAVFCLRLACGMMGALVLVPSRQVNPRFLRAHFLTALGLTAAALALGEQPGPWRWPAFAGVALGFCGWVVWSLDAAPAGAWLIGLTAGALTAASGALALASEPGGGSVGPLAEDFLSAAVLGTSTTAMLIGHSYLTAPAMSLAPLMRLLAALLVALALRAAGEAVAVWSWTVGRSVVNLEEETLLWLGLRWAVGLAAPLVLAGMAREAARIRSTQSATGILYVVVIFCFLGELTSQVLRAVPGSVP